MDTKVAIQEVVIPQLSLTQVKRGLDQRGFASALEKQFTDISKVSFDDCKEASSVKSTDDITINGELVDVKTTDIDKKFKMPNLISIAVLKEKYYSEEILYSFVTYSSKQHKVLDSHLFYIWELPWEHLKIQNLGKGQLQIKNMKNFIDDIDNISTLSKDEWYQEFIKQGEIFYKDLIKKTEKRIEEWVC
tara:strand:+ start:71 stop:640 length:570 start_codon:yes stop_codon:yes gene_type:complete